MARCVARKQVQVIVPVLGWQADIGSDRVGQILNARLLGKPWGRRAVRRPCAAQDPCKDRQEYFPEAEIGDQVVNHLVWRAGVLYGQCIHVSHLAGCKNRTGSFLWRVELTKPQTQKLRTKAEPEF